MPDRVAVTSLSPAGKHLIRVHRRLVLATKLFRLNQRYFPIRSTTSVGPHGDGTLS